MLVLLDLVGRQLACLHVYSHMALSLTFWRNNSFLSSTAVEPGISCVLKVPTETMPLPGRCASTEKARRPRRHTIVPELAMAVKQPVSPAVICTSYSRLRVHCRQNRIGHSKPQRNLALAAAAVQDIISGFPAYTGLLHFKLEARPIWPLVPLPGLGADGRNMG